MQRVALKRIAFATALAAVTLAPALAAKESGADTAPGRLVMTYDGPVMVTPAGMSLYINSAENMKSERFRWLCTSTVNTQTDDQQSGIGPRPNIGFKLLKSCIQKFPAYVAPADAQPVGDFTIVSRPDGVKQWAYKGYPLYTSIRDRNPGERNGAAIGLFAGGGRRGGITFASQPLDLPTGFKMSRQEAGLVVATTDNDRPVYTPHGGAGMWKASMGGAEFKPIAAPAIASVKGDWSIIDSGTGTKQYAFRGKPLFRAPAGVSDDDILASGWELVVVSKGPTVPAAIGKRLTLLGDVYTDKRGRTLYNYNCNGGGVTCTEAGDPSQFMVATCGDGKECAKRWHPYIAAPGSKPEGEFSIIDITYPMFDDMRGTLYPSNLPKVKVWAYRGNPLYTYYEDEKPSDMWGDNIGGLWGSRWSAVQVPGRSATQLEP